MSRVIGTIEARMGSSRLPGKTLLPIFNEMSLLECVVQRFRACRTLADVVVATTVEAGDDKVADWCQANGVSFFRGSEEDVLGRVAGAAQEFGADAIVQMGADSAYLDYLLIDQLVDQYKGGQFDYVCNDLKLTYPLGIYGHVVRVEKLVELSQRADLSDQDHSDVVRYIFEHPQLYAISNCEAPAAFQYPALRLTIDYPQDLDQARNVYAHFGSHLFTTADVIELYRQQPAIFKETGNLVQHSAPFLQAK